MNLWENDNWSAYLDFSYEWHRTGLRLRFEKGIDPEVKRACMDFCKWLRNMYSFPMRVPIYFKASEYVLTKSKEKVSATFFGPDNKKMEPYIRISTGDYYEMEKEQGKDNALAAILGSIAHELTHYFQWIKDIKLTEIGEERQAKSYANFIVDEYSETREHP